MSERKFEEPRPKVQSSKSKYFVTESNYPTPILRKRNHCMKSSQPLPSNKIPKVYNETETIKNYGACEKSLSKLQSFNFKQKTSNPLDRYTVYDVQCAEEKKSLDVSSSTSSNVEFHSETGMSMSLDTDSASLNPKASEVPNESSKFTPFEKQYLDLKEKYSDVILFIQHGNMYKFFDEDAKIASKELSLAIYHSKSFMVCSFLSHCLPSHIHTMVMKGYKVGVVKETDTPALKAAGTKRNELFSRELCAMYTKSTFIGTEMFSKVGYDTDNSYVRFEDVELGYLVCICEDTTFNDKQLVNIGLVGVELTSGDLTYSLFEDGALRTKLDTFLNHVNPSELLLPSTLSNQTMKLLNSFNHDRSVRLERVPSNFFDHSYALNAVNYFNEIKDSSHGSIDLDRKQRLLSLPSLILSCISALSMYLTQFKLENVLKNLGNLKPLSTDENMVLSTATINGLEILKNRSHNSEKSSLFGILNKTITKFGERLLKSWITKPLKNLNLIEERIDVVTEIIQSSSIVFDVLKSMLKNLPDLEKLLCCVFYEKCSCLNFLKLIEGLNQVQTDVFSVADKIQQEINVQRIKIMLSDIPILLGNVNSFLFNIEPEAARKGDKTKVFVNLSMFPELKKCQEEIFSLEKKLDDLKPEYGKILGLTNLKFGEKCLIEVPKNKLGNVPKDWLKISATQQVSRFRSPEIIDLYNQKQQKIEIMNDLSDKAWITFLKSFNTGFCKYKRVISYLAEIDCYLSFANIAREGNYCRPSFSDAKEKFCIHQGCHPLFAKESNPENQLVANDVVMNDTVRCIIVTGPNMGGKSTYVRQTALISIMAQIGSYVPADSATLPVFDNIYVRMGGADDIGLGKSTFMVEMSETSEILSKVTSKSLVILDELGRGTSTNDGTAIAYATLKYLISEVQCYIMFVTHYPAIVELVNQYPSNIKPVHMDFCLKEVDEDTIQERVTFLYSVVSGASEKSYGINVAALAGISKEILCEAELKAQEIELRGKILR